jgi:hypothetical protein
MLGRNSNGSGQKVENTAIGIRHADHNTLYPQKLTLTSPTSAGRSFGILCSRTRTTEFVFVYFLFLQCCKKVSKLCMKNKVWKWLSKISFYSTRNAYKITSSTILCCNGNVFTDPLCQTHSYRLVFDMTGQKHKLPRILLLMCAFRAAIDTGTDTSTPLRTAQVSWHTFRDV